jgi:hypothetical protein
MRILRFFLLIALFALAFRVAPSDAEVAVRLTIGEAREKPFFVYSKTLSGDYQLVKRDQSTGGLTVELVRPAALCRHATEATLVRRNDWSDAAAARAAFENIVAFDEVCPRVSNQVYSSGSVCTAQTLFSVANLGDIAEDGSAKDAVFDDAHALSLSAEPLTSGWASAQHPAALTWWVAPSAERRILSYYWAASTPSGQLRYLSVDDTGALYMAHKKDEATKWSATTYKEACMA